MKKLNLNNRRLKYGSFATVMTVVFIAIVIIINMIMTALTERFPLNIDLTSENIYQISDECKDYLQDLEKDVTITILANEGDFSGYGTYYDQAERMIKSFVQNSSKITLEYVDIVQNPSYVNNYPDLSLNVNDILITSEYRTRQLDINDLFYVSTDQSGNISSVSSKAEKVITSALLAVSSADIPKVVFLTGHGEADPSLLKSLLENNGYETADCAITTEEIPEDAEMVVMFVPTYDLDEESLKKLDAFLNNDNQLGKNLLYFGYGGQGELPNLNAFLAEWGITVEEGMVFETNSSNIYNMIPYMATAEYVNTELAASLVENNIRLLLPYGKGMRVAFEASGNKSTEVLAQYSETAGIVPVVDGEIDTSYISEDNASGPVPAIVLSTQRTYDGTVPLESKVVAVSAGAAFADSSIMENTSFGNADYILSIINNVNAQDQSISIVSKSMDTTVLTLSTSQQRTLGLIFVILVPIAVLVCGIVVWLRKRHK